MVGLQWGDEGKGKLVDLLAREHHAVVRYNGGANAGHSVVVRGERYALHLVPSGILYPGKAAVIGNGVVVDPGALLRELKGLEERGVDTSGLVVSSRAHVVMEYHKQEDAAREEMLREAREALDGASDGEGGAGEIGTTRRGIGPCYAEKVQRAAGIRVGDLVSPGVLREKVRTACRLRGGAAPGDEEALVSAAMEAGAALRGRITDTTYLLHGMLARGKSILFEGANATLLDVDHGTYPYVTASSCAATGIGTGTGVPGQMLTSVIGVLKAYSTRVGRGPLPTELHDELGERIRQRGREYGTTTGRPRRVGWLDLVAVKYAAMVNGATSLALTLLDVLSGIERLKVCTAYVTPDGGRTERFIPDGHELGKARPAYTELPGFADEISGCRRVAELPAAAKRYVRFIEDYVGVPVGFIGVGPDRRQTIRVGGAAAGGGSSGVRAGRGARRRGASGKRRAVR